MTCDLIDRVALVTGAARGIGAATALLLAERGADVVINYRSKGARAERVQEAISGRGRRALLVQADLTNAIDVERMANATAREFGRLDLLFLNASGGLEKDRAAGYAMRLNRDAQVATVETMLPLMGSGGEIVFVTSHWAHFHGSRPVMPAYEPVAASKKAGETALRERISRLAQLGVRLTIVSGDAIDGTITPKLLERGRRGFLASYGGTHRRLPTVEEFAHAIVDAAADTRTPSGHVVFVGSTD
jgi:3-oxoacyl-[acyl-carrier protein] reductase